MGVRSVSEFAQYTTRQTETLSLVWYSAMCDCTVIGVLCRKENQLLHWNLPSVYRSILVSYDGQLWILSNE